MRTTPTYRKSGLLLLLPNRQMGIFRQLGIEDHETPGVVPQQIQ